jgi:integrase
MPARHKAFDPERVTKRSAAEVRKALVLRSVKDSSAEQYASARAVIGRSLLAQRGMRRGSEISDELVLSCTEDEFLLLLGSREEQDAASAEVHRSALLQLHRAAGIDPSFCEKESVKRAVKGVAVAGAAHKVDKGSLTTAMLADLLTFVGPGELRSAIALGFAGELRTVELRFLRVGDVQRDDRLAGEEVGQVTLRVTKSAKAGKPQVSKKVVDASFLRMWEELVAGKKQGEFVFAKGIDNRLRRALGAAATALKWPVDLNWSVHVLRVGGAALIRKRAQEIVEKAFSGQAVSTFGSYARVNEQRLKRGREAQ